MQYSACLCDQQRICGCLIDGTRLHALKTAECAMFSSSWWRDSGIQFQSQALFFTFTDNCGVSMSKYGVEAVKSSLNGKIRSESMSLKHGKLKTSLNFTPNFNYYYFLDH